MSRTKPNTNTKNPAEATFEWVAVDGVWRYWDVENKERVVVDGGLEFAILDQLSNVSGWVKDLGSCRCHETHNITAAPIQVFAWKDGKSRMIKEGMYKEIKDELKAMGIKYHKVVYAMLTKDAGAISAGAIVKLDLGGAAMSEWIESDVRDDDSIATGEGELVKVNAMIKYFKPSFEKVEIDASADELAKGADDLLQEYFDGRKVESVPVAEAVVQDAGFVAEEDDVPF